MKTTKNYCGIRVLPWLIVLMTSACTIEKRRHFSGYHIEFGKRSPRIYPTGLREFSEVDVPRVPVDTIGAAMDTGEALGYGVGHDSDEPPSERRWSRTVHAAMDDVHAGRYARPVIAGTTVEWSVTDQRGPEWTDAVAGEGTPSTRKWARLIGLSLLLMALVAGLTVPAFNSMFVAGDAAKTALNVTSDMARYRTGVGGWIAILALDLLAAFGIYGYSKDKEPKLAKVTGASRLLYSGILGAGVVQLLGVSASSTGPAIYHGLDTFNHLWGIGLILFGVHLVALAFLFKKEAGKNWVSTAIFLLLLVAGIGYIVQYAGLFLVPNPVAFAAVVEPIFIVPMLLGEVSYAIWKLVKGGKDATMDPAGQHPSVVPSLGSE